MPANGSKSREDMCGVYHYDANQAERDAPAVVSKMDLYLSM
jgi:hypothetical protein